MRAFPAALISTLLGASVVDAQPIIEVADSLVCDCVVQMSKVVTLEADEQFGPLAPNFVRRTAQGAYLVVPLSHPANLLVFDAFGSLERVIEGPTQGPPDFDRLMDVQEGPGDSVYVFDASRHLAVLDPELRVARTRRLVVAGGWLGVVDGGDMLLLGGPPPRGGDRIHVLDPEGRVVRSFMRAGSNDWIGPFHAFRRRMATRPDGAVVVGHWDQYVLEIWTASGQHRQTLRRRPSWFAAGRPPTNLSRQAPNSRLERPVLDDSGRLWTMSHVADPDWRDAVVPVRRVGIRVRDVVRPADHDRYFDSVVEVIDPEEAVLLGSLRTDLALSFISRQGFAVSYSEDDAGHSHIDVWELTLVERRRP